MKRAGFVACVTILVGCGNEMSEPELGQSAVLDRADARTAPVNDAGSIVELVCGTGEGETLVSQGIACFTYMAAVCERYAQCRHLPAIAEGCLALGAGCRSEVFVEGSTRTPETLLSCALEFPAFDCERLLRGGAPSCATAGTLPAGARCEGHLACASNYCDYDDSAEERVCYALAEPNGVCRGATVCSPGEGCSQGRCEPITVLSLDSGDAPQSDVGEPCYEDSYCQEGLYCSFAEAVELGTCSVPPPAGEACVGALAYVPSAPKTICDSQSYCSAAGDCLALPKVGERCASRVGAPLPVCRAGSYCDSMSARCVAAKGAAEPCHIAAELSSLSGLPIAPECDVTQGLRCVCTSETNCDADEGQCRRGVWPGASCASLVAECLYGSICTDAGICDYP